MGAERPPLGLQAELVYPDGSTKRLDGDALAAGDQPTGGSFKTQRYTGFADGQFTLARPVDGEYPDLNLLAGCNLIGYDGSTAYEGRVASMPRSLEGSPRIMVMAQGWMSHAADQPFVEAYIDRDLSRWHGPGVARRAALITEGYGVFDGTPAPDAQEKPSVLTTIQGPAALKTVAEAWYDAGPGITLGAIYYAWTKGSLVNAEDANWQWTAIVSEDDHLSKSENTGGLRAAGPGSGTFTPASQYRFAALQLTYAGTATTSGANYELAWQPAMIGPHGLTRHGEGAGGLYASDIIKNIASRWAPKLDTSGVEGTTFAIPQAVFRDETKPYDAFQALNAYHRWEIAVYEGRKLLFYPVDLTDYDWEIRRTDPGVTFKLQGDDLEHLCNGVVVRYTNLATGYEERLTPANSTLLKDENPDNPANRYGETLYQPLALTVPTTEEGALQIGRVFLEEFNQPKAPGEGTIRGHLKDRAGHWQPGWKVRAGDRIVIADLPNPQVRVVGETTWDQDTKTLSFATDGSFQKLDAILARLGVAVEASNLSLPAI